MLPTLLIVVGLLGPVRFARVDANDLLVFRSSVGIDVPQQRHNLPVLGAGP